MSRSPRACALVAALLFFAPAPLHAHDASPGVLGLEELADGRFLVAWSVPVDTRLPAADRVTPRFPAGCRRDGPLLDCGARGLAGEIAIDGLEGSRMRVLIVVTPRDGAPIEGVVDASASRLSVDAHASTLPRWIALGIEHVLLGIDHLAFLLALLLVSSLDRRLVVTVTAFTVAHSLTLGLAVLNLVHPSGTLVEALIALSVLVVAREALRPEPSSVRRAPWAVAAFFGLVHGLGMAGALRDLAIPERSLAPALFGFNVGVELGQLAFVLVAVAFARAGRGRAWTPRARSALAYGVGSAAAYWLVLRTAAMLA